MDLSAFNFTTPEVGEDGLAKTYWPGEFPENEYFKTLPSGEVDLWAPTAGSTTSGSDRTRTEAREIFSGTRTLKNWLIGEHPSQHLRAAMTLTQVTPNGRVVIGQIHVKYSSSPALKILWDNGTILAKLRQHYEQPDDPGFVLLEDVPLNRRFSYSVGVGGSVVSINVSDGSRRGECRFNLLPSYLGRRLYFKAGLYNQEDATAATLPTDGSRARLHSLEVDRS